MKLLLLLAFLFICLNPKAQKPLKYTGNQFFAISVSNTDSTSKWYEDIFQMKLMKEIKVPADGAHIRIIGNNFLKIEILQAKDARSITDCGLKSSESFRLKGFFKTGFYVADLSEAEMYFRSKNVLIKHGPFSDADTHSKSLIIEDLNGLMIQVLEEIK